jgi:hypothetical protein
MITLDQIRDCLEGVVPSIMSTCSPEGVPNVCYLSQVEYIDREHVGLSFQFFNKTRENILANPHAVAAVIDPDTGAIYSMRLRYLRTETTGATFERMRAKLASIAAATGMSEVFRLQGSDIYRVEQIDRVPGPDVPRPAQPDLLAALRACSDELAAATDLGATLDALLSGLARHFAIEHAIVFAIDAAGRRFYTVASRGYGSSGVGSELPLGAGAIGIAAAKRIPIRLAHAAAGYEYVRRLRDAMAADPAWKDKLEQEIVVPGLADPLSVLAVPIESAGVVEGVLYLESAAFRRFSYRDEDALVTLARQLGLAMRTPDPADDAERPAVARPRDGGTELVVRHYAATDSVFFGDDYLIKGVAGAILWKLVRAYVDEGRDAFSNRELRAEGAKLGLPEIGDNLEARLVLLDKRLRDRDRGITIVRTGRGRFRLVVARTLTLVAG